MFKKKIPGGAPPPARAVGSAIASYCFVTLYEGHVKVESKQASCS